LRLLKEKKGGFCSGPELASRLELSRTAIWKHIQSLRSRGYDISSHPKEGYKLVSAPDLLIPEEVVPNIGTSSWLGKQYYYFPQIGSTNDQALLLAGKGAPHGSVVVAEEQTAGKGRLRRPWFSPPGCGIYVTVVLKPQIPVRDAPQVLLVAGLAVVKVLSCRYDIPASVKWPNDVLIRGKKVAGMLAEMQSDQDLVRFLVVGVGINVNQKPEDMQGEFRYPATSIAIERGEPTPRQELLPAFLQQLEKEYERFIEKGFGALLPELEEASGVIGKSITILSGQDEITGTVTGLTPEGGLKILNQDGKEEVIWVGDITRVENFG
jgi:BirA family biotin operon repressor/biotin-[acetyl-CoA-carboxylase] ligase